VARLLADSFVTSLAVHALRAAGHDVDWVLTWAGDPGDPAVLANAHQSRRILITADKGFGALIIRDGRSSCGAILVRAAGSREQGPLILAVLGRHAADLEAGSIIVASPRRISARAPSRT
jgi:predicted nuclease of predicted toxin-antitoxin system